MKVILKQDIKGIGRKYEIKNVSDGYANNFLLPKKLAEFATPDAVKKAELAKATSQAEIEVQEKLLQSQIELLKSTKISISKKANEKGHLFEQVHPKEIQDALKKQAKLDFSTDSFVVENPIKEIGEHKIIVDVGNYKGEFTLLVETL